MHRRTRRIFFWIAILVFGVASYAVMQYAQGYKYDITRMVFVRTGALAITANTEAVLYVNDRAIGSTSLIAHRVGENRLLPGTYSIKLVRDGYSEWRKSVVVKEGLLTDFPSVMLLPTDSDSRIALQAEIVQAFSTPTPSPVPTKTPKPKPTPIATPEVRFGQFVLRAEILYREDGQQSVEIARGVLGTELSDDASRILWFTRNELWVMWINNTDYQPFHVEGEKMLVTRFSTPILRATWFRDRDHIVAELGNTIYRILELDTRGGMNIIGI